MTNRLYIAKVLVKSDTRTKVRPYPKQTVDGHKAGTHVHNGKRNCLICIITNKLDKTNALCVNVYRRDHCPNNNHSNPLPHAKACRNKKKFLIITSRTEKIVIPVR